jgi:hypothetical protein
VCDKTVRAFALVFKRNKQEDMPVKNRDQPSLPTERNALEPDKE